MSNHQPPPYEQIPSSNSYSTNQPVTAPPPVPFSGVPHTSVVSPLRREGRISYGATEIRVQPHVVQEVIVVGGCPVCKIGVLSDDFTCCGICLAIMFFPLGLLFCFLLKRKRCNNCGVVFD